MGLPQKKAGWLGVWRGDPPPHQADIWPPSRNLRISSRASIHTHMSRSCFDLSELVSFLYISSARLVAARRLRVEAAMRDMVNAWEVSQSRKSNYTASIVLETLFHGAHNGDIIEWNSSEHFEMCPPKL